MLRDIIKLLRVKQWVKNGFVLAPLLFAGLYTQPAYWQLAGLAVLAFSLMASAIYVLNDILDRHKDALHPKKRHRPLPTGRVSVATGWALFVIILLLAVGILTFLPHECMMIAAIYVLQNIAYSAGLKRVAVLDVMLIAVGFVLRVLMGAYAIGVVASPWIVLSTFTLALFLGFGKRRSELVNAGAEARVVLKDYPQSFLDGMLVATCTLAALTYAIYAVEHAQTSQNAGFVYTIGFVFFGLIRYLHVLFTKKQGEEPELVLLSDPLFTLNAVLWLVLTLAFLA